MPLSTVDPMTPKVSVVLPVRNGARWLGEALRSVHSQTFADWELLAIDDGWTDQTPGILEDWAARDRRTRVIRQESLGLIAALNRGLDEARGPLLAELDADDRALPDRLDRQVRHLEANPAVGLLGTWAQEIGAAGKRRGQLRPPSRLKISKLADQCQSLRAFVGDVSHRSCEAARRFSARRSVPPRTTTCGCASPRRRRSQTFPMCWSNIACMTATSQAATRSVRRFRRGWRNARPAYGARPDATRPASSRSRPTGARPRPKRHSMRTMLRSIACSILPIRPSEGSGRHADFGLLPRGSAN